MMAYNAAERSEIRKAEKAARLATLNRGAVLKSIASSLEGRRYLWGTLSDAHVFSSTFTGDALRSAFLEGERNAGLRLLNDFVQFCPEEFIQAMREANEQLLIEKANEPEPSDSPEDEEPVD